MKFIILLGFAALFLIIFSCAKCVKSDLLHGIQGWVYLSIKGYVGFYFVYGIFSYLNLKLYFGNPINYSSEYLITPECIQAEIDFIADKGITYPKIIHNEIHTYHYYHFKTSAIQRILIFNSTCNQHATELLRHAIQYLTAMNTKIATTGEICLPKYLLNYWD